MCRLLYVKSKHPFPIEDHLQKFSQIALNSKEYQGHGWGCAFLVEGEWKLYKDIKPVWEDDISSFGSTNLLIAHARSAFKDQDIHVQNNMPFVNGDFVFVFNGELHGVKIKETGKIGAEKIFNFMLRFYKKDMKEAIQKGVTIIKKRSRYIKAMNFILADRYQAYVSSDFNNDPEYFTLRYKQTPDQVIIGSEVYPDESGWEELMTNKIKVFK
jgi:glutamine amidotransferase